MNTKRPDKDDIFHAAAEQPDPAERAAFLADACGDDSGLRAEIEDLLDHDHVHTVRMCVRRKSLGRFTERTDTARATVKYDYQTLGCLTTGPELGTLRMALRVTL